MSANLLNGYEDVSSRYNLATNGQFAINQRGLFASLADCKVNDFVADAWYIGSMTFDYCQAQSGASDGYLRFKGRGKKGQAFTLYSRDTSIPGWNAGMLYDVNGRVPVTAACLIYVQPASVPLLLEIAPRIFTSQFTPMFTISPVGVYGRGQGANGGYFQAVRVIKTTLANVDQGAFINVYLMADGDFEFYLYNFRELLGAYRNPPAAVVHPAEDLQRCERYYQLATVSVRAPLTLVGGNLVLTIPVDLRVTMAGTPTAVTTLGIIDLHQLASAGAGVTAGDQANWGVVGHTATPNLVTIGIQRSGTVANRDTASLGCSTTLTV